MRTFLMFTILLCGCGSSVGSGATLPGKPGQPVLWDCACRLKEYPVSDPSGGNVLATMPLKVSIEPEHRCAAFDGFGPNASSTLSNNCVLYSPALKAAFDSAVTERGLTVVKNYVPVAGNPAPNTWGAECSCTATHQTCARDCTGLGGTAGMGGR